MDGEEFLMDYIRRGRGNHASAWDWLRRGEFSFSSVRFRAMMMVNGVLTYERESEETLVLVGW